ncbi:hypothetical protein Ahy_A04g018594 [Arachis hypogaea]|uniref:Uncharacterized protein n=1 Tax=Arachis hypogaea TaxID=3818 RepID=A0A445DE16_ARAHY|nr:hypothetical protein Ahy_A04g018594 [Arachis hypogaea]
MKSSSPFNLLRQFLLHRHLRFTLAPPQHRAWCTAATPATNPYHLWKEKEEEILRDIEPVVILTKDILHSRRRISNNNIIDSIPSSLGDLEHLLKLFSIWDKSSMDIKYASRLVFF